MKKMMMKQLIKIIKKSKRVAVFGHQSPDGDCLGCISALSFLFKKYNIQYDNFIDDDIPERLRFLQLKDVNSIEFDINNYDLLISVDVASARLLGKYKETFVNFKNTIVIDHHLKRDLNGKVCYVDSKKASCCEVIYELLKKAKVHFTAEVATYLYLGVVDDTGCFLHDNTTAYTHKVAYHLINDGANLKLINYNIAKYQSLKTFYINKLLDNMIVFDDNVYYLCISHKFMKDNNFSKSEIGDYVNKLVNLENCKISFVISEKQKNLFSVSLRCLQGYDVSKVANKFGGGGHIQASGCEITGDFNDILKKVIQECKTAISEAENV